MSVSTGKLDGTPTRIHVMWAQPWQPFTDFLVMDDVRIQHSERKQARCHECRDLRWAKYLKIRVEYDSLEVRCADGCYGERTEVSYDR